MSTALRILILEDDEIDLELIRRLITKDIEDCVFTVANDRSSFLLQLATFQPTVILADNSLPTFDAREALAITQQFDRRIPFILVTGTVSEEFAANVIKEGADDYVLKDRPARLSAAILTAVAKRKAEIRSDQAMAQKLLLAERMTIILDTLPVCVALLDEKGMVIQVNKAWIQLLDESRHTPLGKNVVGKNYQVICDQEGWYRKDQGDDIAHIMHNILCGSLAGYSREYEQVIHGISRWYRMILIPVPARVGLGIVAMHVDITEQKRHEREILRMNDQLRSLSVHLQSIREKEKAVIAREMHEELGQLLSALKIEAVRLNRNMEHQSEDSRVQLSQLILGLDNAVSSVKGIATELRPGILDDLGLSTALEWQSKEFQKKYGIRTIFTDHTHEEHVHIEMTIALFRIFQESLLNIYQHAQATDVNVILYTDHTDLVLRIEDNGIGLDEVLLPEKKGHGLLMMEERARHLKGSLRVETEQGKGTALVVRLPILN